MTQEAAGLVGQAKERVRDIESRIESLRQQRFGVQAELAQLSAQLRESPGDVDLVQRADALRRALDELGRTIPARAYRAGDVRPPLQLELEKARADLDAVRRARWNLARSVAGVEADRDEWAERLPRVVALLDDVLGVFGPGQFPERHRQAETQLRALRAWAVDKSRSIGALPGLRARLADYGPDDGWEPPEVAERGPLGDRPQSVTSMWFG